MNEKETPTKRDKITEFIWSMSKRYTVKEYKGNLDCTQYLTVDEVFGIVNSVKEKRDKGWIEALQEMFPQAELTSATDIDIKHCADELLLKHADVWKSLAKR